MFHCNMSAKQSDFELKENELQFLDLCKTLKAHPFESPWRNCFAKTNDKKKFVNEVTELIIDDVHHVEFEHICKNLASSQTENYLDAEVQIKDDELQQNVGNKIEIDECKIRRVKELLINEDTDPSELAKDLDFLLLLPLQQVPDFCDLIKSSILSETSAAAFLNSILCLERQISLATASTIVQNFIYPKISENEKTNYRTLWTSILSFTEVYPKTVIDEVLIPCLRKEMLDAYKNVRNFHCRQSKDDHESEILFKMVKTNLPDEYTAYCIKAILNLTAHSETMLQILQFLIERKVQHDQTLHDFLSKKLKDFSPGCSNNLKFAKLLFNILSVYGSVLTAEQISMYDEAVKNNRTPMKKVAENVLKRLKSNLKL